MEEWQREYLNSNQDKLKKVTLCNGTLLHQFLTDGVLAKVDLETIRCRPTPSEKARALYEILETRKNGYAAAVKALAACEQTGAVEILVQGYAYCLSPKTPIHFLRETKQLSEYFEKEDIEAIFQQAKEKLSEKQYLHSHKNISAEGIALVRSVQPPLTRFYIPRQLFKRITVNKTLFLANCPDIFVFKGIHSLSQLSTLVNHKTASTSSAQLSQGKLTSRFILLEADDDWNALQKISCVPTHLIKYEEDTKTCLLENTTGGSTIINQHLGRPQGSMEIENADKVISEDELIDGILSSSISSSGVCICDSPGMGKTLLVANMACKISERCPDRLVAFISLPHFVQHVCTRHDRNSFEVDSVYARNSILEYLSTSPVSVCILDRLLVKFEFHMELFFDGFDEVNWKYIQFTRKLLRALAFSLPNTRVFVTSRPNLRHELEASLGVIAFDMVPFTEANQIEFLVSFWKEGGQECVEERLKMFAHSCLESLRCKLTKQEENITGIPLLCRILAQVYSRNAKRFSRSTSNALTDAEDACIFETCLPKLYTKYIEASFKKLEDKSDCISQVKEYIIWMAFKTLFPDFEADYFRQFDVATTPEIFDLGLSMGILEKRFVGSTETVEFVHRTFAEYFVSQFLADMLKNLHSESGDYSEEFEVKVARLLLKNVLMTKDIGDADDFEGNIFINSVLVYFLNFFMADLDTTWQSQTIAEQFSFSVSPNQLYAMIFGCLRDNYASIFKLLQSLLPLLEPNVMKKYKSEMIPDGDEYFVVRLINVASVFSSIPLVDALFTLFRECFSCDLELVSKRMPLHLDTPLHFAIEKADVEKIQYFARIVSLKGRKLLLSSVIKSKDDGVQVVRRKMEMCRLLLSMDKELLFEAPYMLYDSVHVEILKVLIQEGANPAEEKSGQSIVHRAAKYMSPADFHELCRFLIEHVKPNELKWKNTLHCILSQQKHLQASTIKIILDTPGVNVNERNKQENTLFITAVKEHDITILDHLIQAGADIDAININHQNGLHVAAKDRNVPIVLFLVNLGLHPNLQDDSGNTFLHLVASETITADEYHEIVSLLSAKGQTDLFHTKNKNGQLPLHLAINHLEVKTETLHLFQSSMVDFNAVDIEGDSVLMYAAKEGRSVSLMKLLVEMGADVLKINKSGENFAHLISEYYSAEQYHQLVDFLVSKGFEKVLMTADNNSSTPLHAAAIHRELLPETLELIHKNLVKESNVDINITDNIGRTILMCAALGKQNVHFIKSLLDMDADVMIQEENGVTFAHLIASSYSSEEYFKLMQLLIERGHGKVFQTTDGNGNTPLHWAVGSLDLHPETWDLVKRKLVDTGLVNINSLDCKGGSILMASARLSYEEISTESPVTFVKWAKPDNSYLSYRSIKAESKSNAFLAKRCGNHLRTLMDLGADLYIQDIYGDTFSHHISWMSTADQFHEMVEFLICRGHQNLFAVKNKNGKTSIQIAVFRMELLEETLNLVNCALFQANIVGIDSADSDGQSILMAAVAGNRSVSFLKTLIEMGADIHKQEKDGNTFAHLISCNYSAQEYHEMVEFLIGKGDQKVFAVANKNGERPIQLAVFYKELLQPTLDLFNCTLFQTNIVDINWTDLGGDSILMFAAVGNRSVSFFKSLIEMGADIQIQDEDGSTFLHSVSCVYSPERYHEMLEFLTGQGEERSFAVVNTEGISPIQLAFFNVELLDKTLRLINSTLFQTKIVDINATNTNGYSILMSATEAQRSVSLLKTLIEMGADVYKQDRDGCTFAHLICCYFGAEECHEILEFLIKRGEQKVFAVVNEEGLTPIQLAVYKLELLQSTLDLVDSTLFQTKIVSINSTDENGYSILMSAALGSRSLSFLQTLIEKGADIHIRDKNKSTFAHFIASFYSPEKYHKIAEFLLSQQSEEKAFAVVNQAGKTPVHIALFEMELQEKTLDLFNTALFQTNIVDINSTDAFGQSILMTAAVGKRNVSILKSLVEKGADVYIQDEDGDTFAHLISSVYSAEEYHEIVEFLLSRGEQKVFVVKNNLGETTMHNAVFYLELPPETLILLSACYLALSLVDKLLESGQGNCSHGLNALDNKGASVLHWALRGKRSLQFVQQLISLGADWSAKNNLDNGVAHFAAAYGLVEHLKYFVEQGCDVNELNSDGGNVLQCAVANATENAYEMVTFLLEKWADKHHTYAIEKGITDERILNALK